MLQYTWPGIAIMVVGAYLMAMSLWRALQARKSIDAAAASLTDSSWGVRWRTYLHLKIGQEENKRLMHFSKAYMSGGVVLLGCALLLGNAYALAFALVMSFGGAIALMVYAGRLSAIAHVAMSELNSVLSTIERVQDGTEGIYTAEHVKSPRPPL